MNQQLKHKLTNSFQIDMQVKKKKISLFNIREEEPETFYDQSYTHRVWHNKHP